MSNKFIIKKFNGNILLQFDVAETIKIILRSKNKKVLYLNQKTFKK
jgi:hypothetical protein